MTEKKLKILYLITKSNFGGAQKYVLELAIESKKQGHEVKVGCGGTGKLGDEAGLLVNKLEKAGIETLMIKNFVRNMSVISDLLAFIAVWKLILKTKPDVLHVTSSKAGGIGALAGRLSGIKNIIFTSHGLTMDESWRPKWQLKLIYVGTWLTMKLAHSTIMISTETFDRAKSMPGLSKKVHLIKNGIKHIDFLDKFKARKELAPQVSSKAFWIGGIGELHTNKNWSSLIEAMTALPEKIHLIIIGEGEERMNLEELISKHNLNHRVHLVGYLVGAKYLKAYDVFVLPSIKEGLPYVLLEAGLAELPVVASDLPGNRDIVESGKSGLLIDPTPQLLATSIQMLWRDEGMRFRLGKNLSEKIEKDFSIDEMFKQTFLLYSSKILEP